MSLPRFPFTGAAVVLTGAASGMGEHMALQLAERGADLVLVDRDAERLADVAGRIRAGHPGVAVHTEVADLADVDAIPALAERVLAVQPRPTLLVNNAGIAAGGRFTDLSAAEFDTVMAINFRAPVALTRALLPALLGTPGSHVVNVSSLFGLIALPGQSAYSASKFALRGFSEVLRAELAPQQVGVTTVHPGGIRTRIAETALVAASASPDQARRGKESFAKLLTFPADVAARQILDGVERRRVRVLIGLSAKVPDLLARVTPTGYVAVMDRLRPGAAKRRGTAS
ncbi:SDR family NAD(P)-dependent oxidoreductase [Nocardioides sp. ChNu-153]|uniref:SDR family NAD(P)-dependent oxidoreductase n=1 Tax=unclassified Nocardioides TaxID=2615069 RepID=UPI002406AF9A|nr:MULTISPECIES: SDR family NAD(P)-dependent oxidoreductase [unclassified Nocardioides]MDF9718024.1 SDR family NAD(P)-dependent oxidoreductase [Nocardioides sp. ChNu-99]MDN7123028.1 SDR family NAD(P)-dependent oxidoreductase [Nocardioides sp. ChNu-153]